MLKGIGPLGRRCIPSLRAAFAACVIAAGVLTGPAVKEASAAKYSAIIVDAKTGKVLYSKDPDGLRYPASLTKMMTLYLLFEDISAGKITLSTRLKVSEFASRQSPTKLGLRPGSTIAVRDAMLGLITRSANDAAVVIAENLAGSEAAFARRMTATAHSLGMSRTTFRNASGLPNPGQVTTARDMATLGRALQERFPKYYRYFSTRSFVYNGRTIGNHNRLLGRVDGVDGIKTGYTNASGFNLVSSVRRGGRQIVGTVMGGTSGRARDAQMASLIEKYIPSASAGPRTARVLVARAPEPDDREATDPIVTAAAQTDDPIGALAYAPQPRPRPDARPATAAEAAAAVAVEPAVKMAMAEPAPTPAPKPVATQTIVADPVVVTASVAAVGTDANDRSEEGTEGQDLAQGDSEDAAAPQVAAATAVAPELDNGWKIQIAAAPSESGAQSMIERAQSSKASKVLKGATPAVEAVNKGGATFYRARFAGFESKETARAACAQLVKQDFSCLAIRQ